LKQRLNLFYHTYLLIVAANAGVKRQIAMSNGYELARNPEAISDLIRDEQIKVMGCRFATWSEAECWLMVEHAAGSERSQQKADKPKFESERFRRKRTANPTAGAFVR
jgi:hypothetical protein